MSKLLSTKMSDTSFNYNNSTNVTQIILDKPNKSDTRLCKLNVVSTNINFKF